MHYFENETVMSLDNALALKPAEISVLEHVRTYEYDEAEELLPYYVEIRCVDHGVVVRKNRILDFPLYEIEIEELFPTVAEAADTFRKWIAEIQSGT